MRFALPELKQLDFDDVLILPKRSTLQSRANVILDRKFKFRSGQEWTGIPIMTSNMTTVGTIDCAKALQSYTIITSLHKYHKFSDVCQSGLHQDYHSVTMGDEISWMDVPYCIFRRLDVANGYREEFVEQVKWYRDKHPETVVIAGNVCTPEMTEQLLLSGADIVVVGIGTGGQCTTRMKAGVGYPQLSAIIECADAAHGLKGHIVADGGCRTPADVCKAFAAGADFVMLGSMLAAHEENTPPENRFKEMGVVQHPDHEEMTTREYTHIYGMSSRTALEKYHGGVAKHRTSEGKTTKIYLRGSITDTVDDVLASIRSCCTYVGASSLKELSKRTTFTLVNRQRNTFYDNQQVGD